MTSMLPLTTDLSRAFGWTLLHSFWQAFCVYACLRIVLKLWPMASSGIKYHLSFLSLAGISGWFAYTFWNQLNMIKAERLMQEITVNLAPQTFQTAIAQLPQDTSGWRVLFPGMETYFPFIVAAYVVGVVLMTIKLCLDFVQLRQMKQHDVKLMDGAWEQLLARLSASMGVTRKVQLFVSRHLQVPVMIGFVRPVILLPAAMVNNMSTDQLEAILLHELAHIKRNDYLLNIFQSIVETILFFNPFVWWISKNIRLEREHCCDDLVIAGTVQPLQYAKALVALEEYRLTVNPMAMAAADDKHHLLHRIKRIMEMKRTNLNYSQRLLAMLIILMGLVSIAWLNPAARAGKTNIANAAHRDTLPPSDPIAITAAIEMDPQDAIAVAPGTVAMDTDTTPTVVKRKYTIKTDSGKVREYNSLTEMPAEDLKKFEENMERMNEMRLQGLQAQQLYLKALKDVDFSKIQESMKAMDLSKLDAQMQAQLGKINFDKMSKEWEENFKKFDWDKMSKQMEESMKKVDWEKVSKQIEQNFEKIDWKKINDQLEENMKKINWDEINKQLKAQGLNETEVERLKMEMANRVRSAQYHNQQIALGVNRDRLSQDALVRYYVAETQQRALENQETSRLRAAAINQYNAAIMARGRQAAYEAAKAAGYPNVVVGGNIPATAIHPRNIYYGGAANYPAFSPQDPDVLNFIQSLDEAGLIDREKSFEVEKRGGKLYINGKKQSSGTYRKYAQYLDRDNVSITQQAQGTILIEEKSKKDN